MSEQRAYIGPAPGPEEAVAGQWRAHIEGPDGCMTESIDGDLPTLVTWAQARTGWVLILPGPGQDDVLSWAGTDPRPPDVPRDWIPDED